MMSRVPSDEHLSFFANANAGTLRERPDTKPVPKSPDDELFDSFVKALNEPVKDIEFFDCEGHETVVLEHRNFEPKKIMQLLAKQSASQNISPEEFHKDIKNLISLIYKDRQVLMVGPDSESRKKAIGQLEMKYSVKADGNEPDSITRSRLNFMFPHYYFAVWHGYTCEEEHIPSMFSEPQFGGLIPVGPKLNTPEKKAIITVHLYCLNNKGYSLRLCIVLLKKRIQTGLLSDERKVRFLEAKGVITTCGEISATTDQALAYVKKQAPNLEKEIHWNF